MLTSVGCKWPPITNMLPTKTLPTPTNIIAYEHIAHCSETHVTGSTTALAVRLHFTPVGVILTEC